MQNTALRALLSPNGQLWQILGLIVALAALLVSIIALPSKDNNIILVRLWDSTALGTQETVSTAAKPPAVDAFWTFILFNNSSKALLPEAFSEPLYVPRSVEGNLIDDIIACSVFLWVDKPVNLVPFAWSLKGEQWVGTPRLLNPGEATCFALKLHPPVTKLAAEALPRLQFRAADFRLVQFNSLNAAWNSGELASLGLSVILQGREIYAFVLIQALIFLSTLTAFALVAERLRAATVLLATIVMTGSTVCAEAIVYVIYDKPSVHLIYWLPALYGLTLLVALVLFRRAPKLKRL